MTVGKEHQSPSEVIERRRYPRVLKAPLDVNEPKRGILVPLHFKTDGLPASGQFPAWQKHTAALMDCCLPDDADLEDGFVVRQTTWNLGGLLIVQQSTPAFRYECSYEKVRFSPIDHWCITFLRSGCSWTEVDGHVAQNEPGKMEIRSLGHPFRGRNLAINLTSLIVPVDLFADYGGLPVASNNLVLGGHRVRLLMDHLSSVEANLERLMQDDLPGVKDRLLEMVLDAITPLVDRDDDKDRVSQVGLMTRARRFILNNITSPDLTPEALCRELAISRTRLYELFEASGGVASYIRRRRLLTAHAMLADPTDTRTIAEVGLAIGFDSAANFSRSFKQQFDYSPSGIYEHSSASETTLHHADRQKDDKQRTFESLLRTLGLF